MFNLVTQKQVTGKYIFILIIGGHVVSPIRMPLILISTDTPLRCW